MIERVEALLDEVETFPPRAGQADGELLGDSPFEVSVEPLAGRVLVPKR